MESEAFLMCSFRPPETTYSKFLLVRAGERAKTVVERVFYMQTIQGTITGIFNWRYSGGYMMWKAFAWDGREPLTAEGANLDGYMI